MDQEQPPAPPEPEPCPHCRAMATVVEMEFKKLESEPPKSRKKAVRWMKELLFNVWLALPESLTTGK